MRSDVECSEHDAFLLSLLRDCPSFESKKFMKAKSTGAFDSGIRVTLVNTTDIRGIQVGVSPITTTGFLGFGRPVLYFFCFYSGPKAEGLQAQYLYGSELYTWNGKEFKPYKYTWWQRLVKMSNDFGKTSWTDIKDFAQPGENPKLIEQELIKCVTTLGKSLCPAEFKEVLGNK